MSAASMKLPPGMTCEDCAHFARCSGFGVIQQPQQTQCDWAPARFIFSTLRAIELKTAIDYGATAFNTLANLSDDAQALEIIQDGASKLLTALQGERREGFSVKLMTPHQPGLNTDLQTLSGRIMQALKANGVTIAVFHSPENKGPLGEGIEFVAALRTELNQNLPELMQKLADQLKERIQPPTGGPV